MKIAYVFYLPSEMLPIGIFQKIKGQANAAKELKLDIDFIVLNRIEEKYIGNLKLIKLHLPSNKVANYIKRRFFKFMTIDQSVDLRPYDKIIFRYTFATDLFFYSAFWKKYKGKVITIHNSNEIDELKNDKSLMGRIALFLEKKNGQKILSNVIGIIGVSNEITNLQKKKVKINKPSITIPNGIDVANIKFCRFRPVVNNKLVAIFVSSIFQPWQGLNRLLLSLENYNGPLHITLYLIGQIKDKTTKSMINKFENINVTLFTFDNLYGDELDNYFARSNIAIGPLALYKKELNETSALKTIEYIARGIPFIYAYDESNFDENNEFALKLENNDTLIDISNIIKFINKLNTMEDISEKMRNYAFKYLDWKIKMKTLHEFISSL